MLIETIFFFLSTNLLKMKAKTLVDSAYDGSELATA